MQDPNADTEWNDVLRAKGIIPRKEKEVTEDDLVQMLESTINEKSRSRGLEDMSLDELNEREDDIDDEDEEYFEEYRRQRLREIQEASQKARYGTMLQTFCFFMLYVIRYNISRLTFAIIIIIVK